MSKLQSAPQLWTPKDGGALALALTGAYQMEVIQGDGIYADADMESESAGLMPSAPRMSANAQSGIFVGPNEEDPPQTKLQGIILARQETRIHHVPKGDKLEAATARGYHHLLGADRYICRANDPARYPKSATLSPSLTSDQKSEAYALSIGGATGNGCAGCSAAAWNGQTPPACLSGECWLWLDAIRAEPVLLQIMASTTVGPLRRWLATQFRQGRRQLNWFLKIIQLEWVATQSNGKSVKVLKPSVIRTITEPEYIAALQSARDANLWMMPRPGVLGAEPVDDLHDQPVDSDPLPPIGDATDDDVPF